MTVEEPAVAIAADPPAGVVLKLGSFVLRSAADLPDAVQCAYRHVRAGTLVVSACGGETDRLFA
jgi:hypothetical protein